MVVRLLAGADPSASFIGELRAVAGGAWRTGSGSKLLGASVRAVCTAPPVIGVLACGPPGACIACVAFIGVRWRLLAVVCGDPMVVRDDSSAAGAGIGVDSGSDGGNRAVYANVDLGEGRAGEHSTGVMVCGGDLINEPLAGSTPLSTGGEGTRTQLRAVISGERGGAEGEAGSGPRAGAWDVCCPATTTATGDVARNLDRARSPPGDGDRAACPEPRRAALSAKCMAETFGPMLSRDAPSTNCAVATLSPTGDGARGIIACTATEGPMLCRELPTVALSVSRDGDLVAASITCAGTELSRVGAVRELRWVRPAAGSASTDGDLPTCSSADDEGLELSRVSIPEAMAAAARPPACCCSTRQRPKAPGLLGIRARLCRGACGTCWASADKSCSPGWGTAGLSSACSAAEPGGGERRRKLGLYIMPPPAAAASAAAAAASAVVGAPAADLADALDVCDRCELHACCALCASCAAFAALAATAAMTWDLMGGGVPTSELKELAGCSSLTSSLLCGINKCWISGRSGPGDRGERSTGGAEYRLVTRPVPRSGVDARSGGTAGTTRCCICCCCCCNGPGRALADWSCSPSHTEAWEAGMYCSKAGLGSLEAAENLRNRNGPSAVLDDLRVWRTVTGDSTKESSKSACEGLCAGADRIL